MIPTNLTFGLSTADQMTKNIISMESATPTYLMTVSGVTESLFNFMEYFQILYKTPALMKRHLSNKLEM